jgi:hypothetical protein
MLTCSGLRGSCSDGHQFMLCCNETVSGQTPCTCTRDSGESRSVVVVGSESLCGSAEGKVCLGDDATLSLLEKALGFAADVSPKAIGTTVLSTVAMPVAAGMLLLRTRPDGAARAADALRKIGMLLIAFSFVVVATPAGAR